MAAGWLYYSSVPGMAVPGMACPGMAGTGSYPMWIYIGLPLAGTYLDYLDTSTFRALSVVTGNWYTMLAVNSRAGLTVPPPDHRWAPAAGVTFSFLAYRVLLAEARAASARHLAALAARPVTYPAAGPPPLGPPPPHPRPSHPDLTAGRAHNARRLALAAAGKDPDDG